MSATLAQHPLMIAAMLIAAATGAMFFASLPTSSTALSPELAAATARDPAIEQLRAEVDDIEKFMNKPRPSATTTPDYEAVRKDMAFLKARFNAVDARQRSLERVIMASPMRALELPMMRRDIEEIRAAREREQATTKESIDRLYTLLEASIGGILVAVLLMAMDKFLGGRRKVTSD